MPFSFPDFHEPPIVTNSTSTGIANVDCAPAAPARHQSIAPISAAAMFSFISPPRESCTVPEPRNSRFRMRSRVFHRVKDEPAKPMQALPAAVLGVPTILLEAEG